MPRFINPVPQYLNSAGEPIVSGEMYFYEVGSVTPKDVYLDAALTIPAANPVPLGADGRMPDTYLMGTYRTVLFEPSTGQEWERDNVGSDSALGYGAEWDSTIQYNAPNVVLFNGKYYESISNNNIGNNPELSGANWELLNNVTADEIEAIDGGIYAGVPFWDGTKQYVVGNITNVGGTLYQNLVDDIGTNPVGNPATWLEFQYIVDEQVGTTGYRVWSSGVIELWGDTNSTGSIGAGATQIQSVTYPLALTSSVDSKMAWSDSTSFNCSVKNETLTGADIKTRNVLTISGLGTNSYYIRGR